MDPEQLQILSALIQAMPGKNAQQRLNYFQDLMGQLNVDPFGTQQPVMQEWQTPVSKYATTYAQQSEGYKSVFDAIDEGVDPLTATRGAIADDRFPETANMSEDEKSRFVDNVRRVAEQYSFEQIENQQNQAEFLARQQREMAEAPRALSGLLPSSDTAYSAATERLGFEPTAENLLREYSQFLYEKGQEREAERPTRRAAAAPAAPATVPRPTTTLSPGGTTSVMNLPAPPAGQAYEPGSLMAPPAAPAVPAAPVGGKGVPASFDVGAKPSIAPEGYGFTGRTGDVRRQMFTAAAERAGDAARKRRVDTSSPESQQFMQNLAYALLLQGD